MKDVREMCIAVWSTYRHRLTVEECASTIAVLHVAAIVECDMSFAVCTKNRLFLDLTDVSDNKYKKIFSRKSRTLVRRGGVLH